MKQKKSESVELEPDAWARFERAVDVVAKSPPQHRTKAAKSPTNDIRKKRASGRRKTAQP